MISITVSIDPTRLSRDTGTIEVAVVQNLAELMHSEGMLD